MNMSIEYKRPTISDITGISELFKVTFTDTFKRNNIVDIFAIDDEINGKIEKVKKDIIELDDKFYFIIAKDVNLVVGICAFFPVSEIIRDYINKIEENDIEIGCTYVLPNYQNQGIAKKLIELVIEKLKEKNIRSYFLCSGFKTAQDYWIKKLGEPIYTIENIWGMGKHEIIWKQCI
jgi:ribosomal protein S18 acetylase RimI-like enzyme